MNHLEIKFDDFYKVRVICTNSNIIDGIIENFTINERVAIWTRTRNGPSQIHKTVKHHFYQKSGKYEIVINAGLYDYLVALISKLVNEFNIPLDLKITPWNDPVKITLSDEWRNRFNSHPRGEPYNTYQSIDFPRIINSFSGIAELFTGYGKTELISAMVDGSTVRTVVLAPDNAIRDEIKLRFDRYNIDHGIEDWSKRVNIINPIGLLASHRFNDDAKEWLNDVQLALTDECHHASADSWQNIYSHMRMLRASYGFSASADVGEGQHIHPAKVVISELSPNILNVIKNIGISKIHRKLPTPVKLVKMMTPIVERDSTNDCKSWQEAFDRTITHDKLPYVLQKILLTYPERSFFVPIHKKESGAILHEALLKMGYKSVMWTANGLYPKELVQEGKTQLESLKLHMAENRIDFLFSTRVEGIDLPGLNGIIPLVGTSHRMVIQPVGRSARMSDVVIVLVYDTNSPIVLSQSKKRRERMEAEYNIVSDVTMRMQ